VNGNALARKKAFFCCRAHAEHEALERKLAEAIGRMPEPVRGIVPLGLAGEQPKDIAGKLGLKVRRVYRWIEWVKKEARK
jgi:hypothetical protein